MNNKHHIFDKTWNKGFAAGASQQRKADENALFEKLTTLEEIKGVGEKTACKVRDHILEQFRQ